MNRRKVFVPAKNVVTLETDNFDEQLTNDKEVLLKNLYSHISAGTELACLAGLESFFQIPDTPGYTAIAEVMETGAAVTHVQKGDIVFTFGPHAEYFKIDTTCRWKGVCVKLPAGIDPKLAAFAHMGNIAITALRNSSIELGDDVLVTGLGAIGNIITQLVQLQGGKVIATDINEQRLAIAKECGINGAVNSMQVDLKTLVEEKTNGKLVSTYIDASGSSKVIESTVDLVGFNGETILLGSPRAPHQTNLTDFLQRHHLLPWNHTLKGALEFTYPTFEGDFHKHSVERNVKVILDLINEDKLKIQPFFSHLMNPKDGQEAYDGLRSKPESFIGVVFDWTV